MAVKEKSDCEEMEWNSEEEIQLFLALGGLKPIGINKHINMACICKRLSNALKRDIQPDIVWAHLNTMYNLEVLNQMEPLPLPQDQREFSMPESEFSSLISKKLLEEEKKLEEKSEAGHKSKSTTPQPQTSNKLPSSSISKPSQSNTQKSTSISPKPSQSNATKLSQILTTKPSQSTSKASPTPTKAIPQSVKHELEKKIMQLDTPKRTPKRTRGSMSIESNSPSTTPPPTQTKRRRM